MGASDIVKSNGSIAAIVEEIPSDRQLIGAEIMRCFALKGNVLDKDILTAFAKEAANDGFTPQEVAKACAEVARDRTYRRVIYADIYELALPLKKQREEREKAQKYADFIANSTDKELFDHYLAADSYNWPEKYREPLREAFVDRKSYSTALTKFGQIRTQKI